MKKSNWKIAKHLAVAALGLSAFCCRAEEARLSQVETALSQTVLSGYIGTSASINFSGNGEINFTGTVDAVPEPSSTALMAVGLAAGALIVIRKMAVARRSL